MTATQVALSELTALRELTAALMFEHTINGHHSNLCQLCKRAHALGIKPGPEASDSGLMADIQRAENMSGDGYFGYFDWKGGL
jgi:hypothetical protein